MARKVYKSSLAKVLQDSYKECGRLQRPTVCIYGKASRRDDDRRAGRPLSRRSAQPRLEVPPHTRGRSAQQAVAEGRAPARRDGLAAPQAHAHRARRGRARQDSLLARREGVRRALTPANTTRLQADSSTRLGVCALRLARGALFRYREVSPACARPRRTSSPPTKPESIREGIRQGSATYRAPRTVGRARPRVRAATRARPCAPSNHS